MDNDALSRPPLPASGNRLDSWKEIAAYLKRDPRTVQRWEKSEGLPVHRHLHDKLSTVYAYKSELDKWWLSRRSSLEESLEPPSISPGDAAVLPGASERIMLAVLPFESLGSDPEQEYFTEGLTEEMITQLGRLQPRRLGVIAGTTVRNYKNSGKSVKEIGRDLNVQYVLEGSARRGTGSIRVSAQLIQASDQTHLWAETFDEERAMDRILEIQGEVAAKVARSLALELLPTDLARLQGPVRRVQVDSYQSYLRGRYLWNKRGPADLLKSVDFFQQAIQQDPENALAHAGIADAYNVLGFFSILSPAEAYPRAKQAAQKALELDDSLAEAHASLADALYHYDFDWERAGEEYERAIQLNPNYATAHHWYAVFLMLRGRSEAAWKAVQRAHELDPLSLVIDIVMAMFCFYSRQYERAIEQCRSTIALEPSFGLAHFWLGRAFVQMGAYSKGIAEYWSVLNLQPDNVYASALLGHAYAVSGETEKAEKMLGYLNGLSHKKYVSHAAFVLIHMGLGRTERALVSIEKAREERAALVTHLKVDPIVDDVRSEPRFQEVLRGIGLL